ncbi:centrosomal protein of 72 kDa [Elysia marginata]|uniref:Centrosomal protein of 72 kDa n=1 Tax=Elysia marginata TaxID=1093978 RepID=A0AAV4EU91_9GAST|nr:centrosomal protein of 72 kDa [Elysia marginata]
MNSPYFDIEKGISQCCIFSPHHTEQVMREAGIDGMGIKIGGCNITDLSYYNNISSLEELTRLKHNPNLQEIDLRLNPVTRNEPDYRLYLIHMLPNLRKLDDRGVRDRERQAALTHFSSSQAAEMSVASSTSVSAKSTTATSAKGQPSGQSTSMTSTGTSNSSRSRQEMMAKLMKGPSILVDDDVAVIDALEKNELDYGKTRSLTGSSAKEDKAEDYSLDALKMLDQPKPTKPSEMSLDDLKENTKRSGKRKTASAVLGAGDPRFDEYKEQYPNIMAAPLDSVQRIGENRRQDPNLQFPDEVEASSKYKGQGYFTPNPGASNSDDDGRRDQTGSSNTRTDDVESRFSRSDRTEYRKTSADTNHNRDISSHDDLTISHHYQPSRSLSAPGREKLYRKVPEIDEDQTREKNLLFSLLNLVDRYWNGSKSLHKHPKFIEQALQSLSEYTLTRINRDETRGLRKMVERLQEENTALMAKVESHATEALTSAESELKDALKKARQDMESMHREIRHYVQENRALQKLVDTNESAVVLRQHHSGAASSETADAPQSQRQREALQQELEMMRSKVRQYDQVQELALMLQESHRSLVETNDHLLRELVETRQRHKHEVSQLNWNYQQLKATMGYSAGSHQRGPSTVSGHAKENLNEDQPASRK